MRSDTVDVWRLSLNAAVAELPVRLETLAPTERERALKLVREQDRATFVMVRSILRQILAAYVGATPSSVRIEYGPAGKPRLAGASPIRFNVSHSENIALIAVSTDRELGVDVELRQSPMPRVPDELFSKAEVEEIHNATDPLVAFYDHWTMKEALLKGLGDGLGHPALRGVVGPSRTIVADNFELRTLGMTSDYSAAIAIERVFDECAPKVLIRDDFQ